MSTDMSLREVKMRSKEGLGKIFRVLTAYQSAYPDPLRISRGERLTVQPKETGWKGWAWCITTSGKSGWVPEKYLQETGNAVIAMRDYDATELSVIAGEDLTVMNEESGWLWCENQKQERGWVPAENVQWLSGSASANIFIRPLTSSSAKDFFWMREHPSCDWCFCVAWHVPTWDGWTERSATENRTLRDQLLKEGKYDGYLLYVDGKPVGWCQCAPLNWFSKLVGQMDLGDEPAGTFVIGCLEILPEHRKQGLSRILLNEVLADLRRRGVARVVSIPRTGRHEDGKVWTGPASLFESCYFKALKTIGDRQVMVLQLIETAVS